MNALESALHHLQGHAWPGCSGKSSHSEKSGPSASRSCCALALRRCPASFHSTPMSLQSCKIFQPAALPMTMRYSFACAGVV